VDLRKFKDRLHPIEFYLQPLRRYPIVRLGGLTSRHTLVLDLPSPLWKSALQVLVEEAHAILVVPGLSPGIKSELDLLNDDRTLLGKTIIVQPPGLPDEWDRDMIAALGGNPNESSPPSTSRDREWRGLASAWVLAGHPLPAYRPEGQIVCYGYGGDEAKPVSRQLNELRAVVDAIPASSGSLRRGLDRLEAALNLGRPTAPRTTVMSKFKRVITL
jgi:hypothetical protein